MLMSALDCVSVDCTVFKTKSPGGAGPARSGRRNGRGFPRVTSVVRPSPCRPVRSAPGLFIALLGLVSAGLLRAAEPVPREYADTYTGLEQILDTALAKPARADPGPMPLVSTDLLIANSNRGPMLLEPATLAAVGPCLDRIRQLGIGCVKFALQYPLLRPDFPDAARYLDFYRQVVAQAHARGLKVMPHVTVLFADTPFSPFQGIYRGLDLPRFKREYRDMVRLVARELQPDYLVLLTEPDTHARLTGLGELTDPKVVADVINFALDGLDRGRTRIGAGSGSWSGTRYAAEIAAHTAVDFVCIHVYPIGGAMLDHAREMARIARAAGKQVVVDEAWLYKTLKPGGGNNVAAAADIFRRDPYSFWQPLDEKFTALMLRLAREERIELVSFYWSTEFFAYIPYAAEFEKLPYAQASKRYNRAAYEAITTGKLSATGDYLHKALQEARR